MNSATRIAQGRMPATRILMRVTCVVVIFLCFGPSAVADEDPYLQMLDEEATKVGGTATDKEVQQGETPSAPAGPAPIGDVPSRAEFETLLRVEHVGTYSFYRRLPERSREEIFLDYLDGASIESLRGKIVDRYLHP